MTLVVVRVTVLPNFEIDTVPLVSIVNVWVWVLGVMSFVGQPGINHFYEITHRKPPVAEGDGLLFECRPVGNLLLFVVRESGGLNALRKIGIGKGSCIVCTDQVIDYLCAPRKVHVAK